MNITLVPEHIAPEGLADMLTPACNKALTDITILLEIAGEPVEQLLFDVITQETTSLFNRNEDVNELFVSPEIFIPLSCHWKAGLLPPFIGLAVNATLVPEHIAPVGFATILTLTGNTLFTFIVIEFDIAGEPAAHVAFDDNIQVTTSLLFSNDDENELPPVPVFIPFTFH